MQLQGGICGSSSSPAPRPGLKKHPVNFVLMAPSDGESPPPPSSLPCANI